MKVHLKLNCETLAGVRAELEAFLAPGAASAAASTAASTKATPAPASSGDAISPGSTPMKHTSTLSAADIALGLMAVAPSPSARKNGQTQSAADIALGLASEDSTNDSADDVAEPVDTGVTEGVTPPPSEAEALLADKAQLNFDFDRVLALQGRAAALGIVRGVLPRGSKTKLKDIESLPVELIPAAIAALQAAGAD
jgi:hypothetical protein